MQNEKAALVKLSNVVKVYETGDISFTALKSVGLEINSGEFVAIIGKSGSGKSTLINMITGIDRPTSGEVNVSGTIVNKLNESQLAIWRGRNIGVVFQFFQLLPTLNVLENVTLPMHFCKTYPLLERNKRGLELLKQVDMVSEAYKLPHAISGGQQQRVAIARALANSPPIIIADEPTGNLDSKTADSVFQLFKELVFGGKTIVFVTHDTDLAERVSRIITIADGNIVEDRYNKEFFTSHPQQLVGE